MALVSWPATSIVISSSRSAVSVMPTLAYVTSEQQREEGGAGVGRGSVCGRWALASLNAHE
eukprot:353651-Chlamydomonas_euryale.AAC.1